MNFRKYHLLNLLKEYEKSSLALDIFLQKYFRAHKQLGSKDRKEILDTIYPMIRWRGLIDFLSPPPVSWEKRLETYQSCDFLNLQKKEIPSHIRWSFPKYYFEWIVQDYGEQKAAEIAKVSNQKAPVFLRVNPLKTTRDKLLEELQKKYTVSACKAYPLAIKFLDKANFFALDSFKEGLFEIQDLGSQIVADQIKADGKSQVLDYCAGAGGKTLGFAHKMQNRGQIYLHDIRKNALLAAKKRLARADIQNVQFFSDKNRMRHLKGKMDWVLADVPCSGSGTLRRNPDMKWRFKKDFRENLILEQRKIFEEALSYMKKSGKIVYATCSLFRVENEDQVEYFAKKYNLKIEKTLQWLPKENGMDGFFVAIFSKI